MPHDFKEKPACATTGAAAPTEMECPSCGEPIEVWSDDEEARCTECGHTVALTRVK